MRLPGQIQQPFAREASSHPNGWLTLGCASPRRLGELNSWRNGSPQIELGPAHCSVTYRVLVAAWALEKFAPESGD